MASNINLGMVRIAEAAIQHTLGNRKRFTNLGFLQAARSPQNAGLIAEMNPRNAYNDNRLSLDTSQATPKARVRLNYRPQLSTAVKTARTVATGANPVGATSLFVDYLNHLELDHTYRTVDLLALEAAAESYLGNAQGFTASVKGFSLLSDMGDQIMRKMDPILVAANASVGTSMIAAVGGNLMIGTVSPANTAVPNVNAFKADGSIHLDFYDWINNLKTIHSFEGVPIVVGGLKALTWFNRRNIASPANLGYDYGAALAALDTEFYYDPSVDTLSGADHIIVMEPGAFCLESWMEHAPINEGGVIPFEEVGFTQFGSAAVQIAQTAADTFALEMDLRVREDDSIAYPQFTVTPSLQYGTFARPAGLIKNYGGWDTHTGIFRAKLVTSA